MTHPTTTTTTTTTIAPIVTISDFSLQLKMY